MNSPGRLHTQRGKLAALPFYVLLDLNARLLKGDTQSAVLAWLNALPVVAWRMKEYFGGEPISTQNISSWYRRDYQFWLQHIKEVRGKVAEPQSTGIDSANYRKGKIARLPQAIRDEVCRRMHDGETGKNIVEWLNGHPAVIGRMAIYFDGQPVSSQNLSQWRRGGYQDYLRRLEVDNDAHA